MSCLRTVVGLAAALALCACKSEERKELKQTAPVPTISLTNPPPPAAPAPTEKAPAPLAGEAPAEPAPPRVATTCPKEMASIPVGGCIDKWEASAGKGELGKPDGTTTTLVAESVPGRMPLADVTVPQARAACKNAGKRLCSEGEWRSTCKNRTDWKTHVIHWYPYGAAYEARRCNDWHASDHGNRGAAPTGTFERCTTPTGVYDMANNVGEITDSDHPSLPDTYEVHGGTFYTVVLDSSCDEDDFLIKSGEHFPNAGFRCCSDGTPASPTPAKASNPTK